MINIEPHHCHPGHPRAIFLGRASLGTICPCSRCLCQGRLASGDARQFCVTQARVPKVPDTSAGTVEINVARWEIQIRTRTHRPAHPRVRPHGPSVNPEPALPELHNHIHWRVSITTRPVFRSYRAATARGSVASIFFPVALARSSSVSDTAPMARDCKFMLDLTREYAARAPVLLALARGGGSGGFSPACRSIKMTSATVAVPPSSEAACMAEISPAAWRRIVGCMGPIMALSPD